MSDRMGELFELELGLGIELEPLSVEAKGKRLFRVPVGKGHSLIIGMETEVDPGVNQDIRRCRSNDDEVKAFMRWIARLVEMAGKNSNRGAKD